MIVTYFHPLVGKDGKRISTANIIWNHGRFEMRSGKFPIGHPCASLSGFGDGAQAGKSPKLDAFRARGYWASCFPEGDGITLKWWDDVPEPTEKTAEQVMRDIAECFGWDVKQSVKS